MIPYLLACSSCAIFGVLFFLLLLLLLPLLLLLCMWVNLLREHTIRVFSMLGEKLTRGATWNLLELGRKYFAMPVYEGAAPEEVTITALH